MSETSKNRTKHLHVSLWQLTHPDVIFTLCYYFTSISFSSFFRFYFYFSAFFTGAYNFLAEANVETHFVYTVVINYCLYQLKANSLNASNISHVKVYCIALAIYAYLLRFRQIRCTRSDPL